MALTRRRTDHVELAITNKAHLEFMEQSLDQLGRTVDGVVAKQTGLDAELTLDLALILSELRGIARMTRRTAVSFPVRNPAERVPEPASFHAKFFERPALRRVK